MDSNSSLDPFLKPRGVAVMGASQDPTKLGYGLARNLVLSNYPGAVHFINPKGGILLGRPVYASIIDAPDPLDLAILLIPAAQVPAALQECGQRGVKAAIIGSGGFRETGAQGAELEAACLRLAQSLGIRLLGPNCVGLLDTHLPINATFLPPPSPLPGEVAFVSHSGAICAAVIDWARGQGFGLSRLISLGNQADVTETDMLAPLAADPQTRVLTLYLEGISNGRRFTAEAGQAARRKPIVALKVGRFASGRQAVASHTGALAGEERAYNAAFRRAGVIRAETSEEMFDWARALAWAQPPALNSPGRGRAVAVLTNAGGPGVTAADALEAEGMRLAQLGQETRAALQASLPPAASLHNPVDMLASAPPELYATCLRILLADPGVDSVLVILPPPPMYAAGAVAKALIPVIHSTGKPVVVAVMGDRLIQEAVEHFRAARVPEYRFPERAASALAVLARRAEFLACSQASPERPAPAGRQAALPAWQAFLANLPPAPGRQVLPQETLQALLAAYGLASAAARLARSAAEAAALARQAGFPVALKIASPDIPHKSDVGGVRLGLENEAAVLQAFEAMFAAARQARPEAEIHGVYVQRMAPPGQDVIVGAVQDKQFGPLVMFGSGGVEVEGLNDVAFALAPTTAEEAETLLENTWAGRKLRGFRSLLTADRSAAKGALLRLAQLAADFPELAEIEINPLRVLAEGQGVIAIDARGLWAPGEGS